MNTQQRRTKYASASCALLALTACAGSGDGLDSNGRPLSQGNGGAGPLTADFASLQEHVFTPICTACHAGAAAPQGLRLDAANSYALLVGVPSTEVPTLERVRAGDPDNSYIVQKLEGHAAVGAQMPLGGPYLDVATLAALRQWISDGALPPVIGAAAAGSSYSARAAWPADGAILEAAPARIVVALSGEVDVTRLDEGSLRLVRVDAQTQETIALDIAPARADPRALVVTPRSTLPPGLWRLEVPAAPQTGLADIAGRRAGGDAPADAPLVLATFLVLEHR